VIFDYFFPDVIPGSPVDIPPGVVDNWDSLYEHLVRAALRDDPHAADQLLAVTRFPQHPLDREATVEAVVDALWYNVFSTNDGVAKLGGQPFDNLRRYYRGSDNDLRLNRLVERFAADPDALAEIEQSYQTSGDLTVPLVTLHTVWDPIVPYSHEPLYRHKVTGNGDGALHTDFLSLRYGHCNFSVAQTLAALAWLVFQVSGRELENVDQVLPDSDSVIEYRDLIQEFEVREGG
jgi:hypothetical protein